MNQWEVDLHARIARVIKKTRGKRSAQWLAERTAELGYPMTRAQIANYESGRKKRLDIAEFLVLCAALDTSPVSLLFPGPYEKPQEVIPGHAPAAFFGAQWWSGHAFIRFQHAETDSYAQWRVNTNRLRLWRDLATAARIRTTLLAQSADGSQIEHYDQQISRISEELGVNANDVTSVLDFRSEDA